MSDSADGRTYVVTGAASGIGAATTHYLRERGGRVIACDLHQADVIGDLTTIEGRAAMVEGVSRCRAVESTQSLQTPEAVRQRPCSH